MQSQKDCRPGVDRPREEARNRFAEQFTAGDHAVRRFTVSSNLRLMPRLFLARYQGENVATTLRFILIWPTLLRVSAI